MYIHVVLVNLHKIEARASYLYIIVLSFTTLYMHIHSEFHPLVGDFACLKVVCEEESRTVEKKMATNAVKQNLF